MPATAQGSASDRPGSCRAQQALDETAVLFDVLWAIGPAALDRQWAARMETAAGRDVGRVGIALAQADIRDALVRLRRQHRGQQRARIGMPRIAEQRVRVAM